MKKIIVVIIAIAVLACANTKSPITAEKYEALIQDVEALRSEAKEKDKVIESLRKKNQKQKSKLNMAKDLENQVAALQADSKEAKPGKAVVKASKSQAEDKAIEQLDMIIKKAHAVFAQPAPASQPVYNAMPPLPPPSSLPSPLDIPDHMNGFLYSKPAGNDLNITFTPYDGTHKYYVAVWVNGEPVSFGDVASLKLVKDLDDTEFAASLIPRGAYAYVPVDASSGWSVEVQYFQKIINYQQMGQTEYAAVGSRQLADDNVHVKHRAINLNNYAP
ncbi:hypothetical protein KJ969_05060 [Patescibacteria group bacterium]|nr:hypothetical protein [Patescibacteria group bacterium]MBU1921904.1 hypothetical protein [Patescibacteria group bacterium]